MASRPHHHRRRRAAGKRRTPLVLTAAAVAAAGLIASLVMALRPDGEAAADSVAATPAASREVTASPSSPGGKRSTASPTPTATATTRAATRPATTAPRKPSPARSTRRTASTDAPLAGRIKPDVTYDGVATHYDAGDGNGACLYGPSEDLMIAAMNTADYETSKACGAYVRVSAAGGASITVRITNECPAPCAPGQLDLSRQAFAKLADPSRGRIPITWSLLSPSTSDKISIRYKTGSSRYWCAIQVLDHRNPVARLEVRADSGWRQLPRTEYNYFLSEQGSGCGGAIRITDIYGEQLTVDGIAVRPDAVQPTRVQFAQH